MTARSGSEQQRDGAQGAGVSTFCARVSLGLLLAVALVAGLGGLGLPAENLNGAVMGKAAPSKWIENAKGGAAPRRRHHQGRSKSARGDVVSKGEVLIVLEDVQTRAELIDLVEAQISRPDQAERARLHAERDWK